MGEGLKLLADPVNDWVLATLLVLPRLLVIIQFWPVFSDTAQSPILKNTAAMGLLVLPAWHLYPHVDQLGLKGGNIATHALTEAVAGLLIGLAIALPFYTFKAFGALIDVLRGTTFSVLINPSSGGEELTSERLAGMAFGLWLLLTPLWLQAFELVYESYLILPPGGINLDGLALAWPSLLRLFSNHLLWALQYLAPVFVLILFSEAVLYLISGYASSIQVYSVDAALRTLVCLWMILMLSWFSPDAGIDLTREVTNSGIGLIRELLRHER